MEFFSCFLWNFSCFVEYSCLFENKLSSLFKRLSSLLEHLFYCAFCCYRAFLKKDFEPFWKKISSLCAKIIWRLFWKKNFVPFLKLFVPFNTVIVPFQIVIEPFSQKTIRAFLNKYNSSLFYKNNSSLYEQKIRAFLFVPFWTKFRALCEKKFPAFVKKNSSLFQKICEAFM